MSLIESFKVSPNLVRLKQSDMERNSKYIMENKKTQILVKLLTTLNFSFLISLYFLKPASFLLISGLVITQFFFSYSYFKLKRKLTIPMMLVYLVYSLSGIIDATLDGGLSQGNSIMNTALFIGGNIAVLSVGYYTYRNWIKGKW